MTAFTGVNLRQGGGYWELSGPMPINRSSSSCRACKKVIYKNSMVMVRDGRKMRFFYHQECFRGDADPRTQSGEGINSLEKNLKVFQPEPPDDVGHGKWSTTRGYQPVASSVCYMGKHGATTTTRLVRSSHVGPKNSPTKNKTPSKNRKTKTTKKKTKLKK
eukprot:GSMAST32.ASY1.ANO1.1792.1 assembled CDS